MIRQNLYKLTNPVVNAHWGSSALLSTLFSLENRHEELQAELHIGSYPMSSSKVEYQKQVLQLHQLLRREADRLLGENITNKDLPFMLKVLTLAKPHSLHFHPTKAQAKKGFLSEPAKEEYRERFFKDQEAKYELFYALEDGFEILAGLSPVEEVLQNFYSLSLTTLSKELIMLEESGSLLNFIETILQLNPTHKKVILNQLAETLMPESDPMHQQIAYLLEHFPQDTAALAPLFMHSYKLALHEAIWIEPGMLHLALSGTALEASSASDNILRLALTQKATDLSLLSLLSSEQLPAPTIIGADPYNPLIPIPSHAPFQLQAVHLEEDFFINGKNPASLIFCSKGKAHFIPAAGNPYLKRIDDNFIPIRRGEAYFMSQAAGGYEVRGRGLFFIASYPTL